MRRTALLPARTMDEHSVCSGGLWQTPLQPAWAGQTVSQYNDLEQPQRLHVHQQVWEKKWLDDWPYNYELP